jgi:hypothetical protein
LLRLLYNKPADYWPSVNLAIFLAEVKLRNLYKTAVAAAAIGWE